MQHTRPHENFPPRQYCWFHDQTWLADWLFMHTPGSPCRDSAETLRERLCCIMLRESEDLTSRQHPHRVKSRHAQGIYQYVCMYELKGGSPCLQLFFAACRPYMYTHGHSGSERRERRRWSVLKGGGGVCSPAGHHASLIRQPRPWREHTRVLRAAKEARERVGRTRVVHPQIFFGRIS
jgi:hypothetical protein